MLLNLGRSQYRLLHFLFGHTFGLDSVRGSHTYPHRSHLFAHTFTLPIDLSHHGLVPFNYYPLGIVLYTQWVYNVYSDSHKIKYI